MPKTYPIISQWDVNMTDMQSEAFERLRKWSDPQTQGNPTKRMTQIWRNPKEMAKDVHVLLQKVAEAQ
jgi:hypothetical protein